MAVYDYEASNGQSRTSGLLNGLPDIEGAEEVAANAFARHWANVPAEDRQETVVHVRSRAVSIVRRYTADGTMVAFQ